MNGTPITQQLCQTWPVNQATTEFGPTPTATGVAALVNAIAALEAAVIALQGD